MELLDRIRRYRALEMPHFVRVERHESWRKHAARMLSLIRDREIPAYEISDVSDYYYTGSDQEYWSLDRDFGPFTPPHELFWMEHRHPLVIASEEEGNQIPPVRGWTGWLMFGCKREAVTGDDIPPDTHWILAGELFIDYRESRFGKGVIQGPHGTWCMGLTEHGRLVNQPPSLQSWAGEEDQDMMQLLLGWWHPSLLAIGYLNSSRAGIVSTAKPLEWEIRKL